MGNLVFQATLGGQVNLVGPNTASTFNLNVPAVSSTLATLTGTETFTNKTLTSPTLTTPVLGTPASGTLTNCTSLPVGGITATGTPSSTTFLRGDSTWATITATTPGGSTTQVQYNSSGSFAGSANMTFNGTALTLANDASISGLTVGKGGGAVSNNTALGSGVLSVNTSGASNTGVGINALNVNTTGSQNNSVGQGSLGANTTGSANSAFGHQALNANTTATNNVAVGYQAGYSNQTGGYNVFVGTAAGYSSTSSTGNGNVFVGQQCGYNNTTGVSNSFFGAASGYYVSSGSKNTILGSYSGNQGGLDIRTASNYIVLSDGDGNIGFSYKSGNFFSINGIDANGELNTTPTKQTCSADYTDGFRWNQTGNSYWNKAGNGAIINFRNSGSSAGNISNTGAITSYNSTSDYRMKKNVQSMTGGLSKLMQLRPVIFDWIYDNRADNGFIAHELQEVLPNAVFGEKDALDKDGNILAQGIDPRSIVATLTSALQELNAKFDAYVASHP